MSWDISVFVKSNCSFEDFVNNMQQLFDVNFLVDKKQEWSYAYFSGMGLTIRLIGDLDYDDDLGISFSDYSYQINVDTYSQTGKEYMFNIRYNMAMYIYDRIIQKLSWKCMVVEEMQNLLARN